MNSECRVPICNLTSSVMRKNPSLTERAANLAPPLPGGKSQGDSFSLCCWAKSCDDNLLAAPESIRAVLIIILF